MIGKKNSIGKKELNIFFVEHLHLKVQVGDSCPKKLVGHVDSNDSHDSILLDSELVFIPTKQNSQLHI